MRVKTYLSPHILNPIKKQQNVDAFTRSEFESQLSNATNRNISKEEMDLICAAFDDDGDEELQLETYTRIVNNMTSLKNKKKHLKQKPDATTTSKANASNSTTKFDTIY